MMWKARRHEGTEARRGGAVAGMVVLGMVVSGAWAAPAGEPPTLDQLLELPAEGSTDASAPSGDGPPVDPALQRELDGERPAELFSQVVELMDTAAGQLGVQRDLGIATQRIQQSILAKLDQLIAEAEKNQCKGSSSQSKSPSSVRQDTGDARNASPGPAGATPTGSQPNRGTPSSGRVERVQAGRPIEQLRREWGHLPPRVRDQLIQGFEEPFSPIYQTLTERYYRRLAEEGR